MSKLPRVLVIAGSDSGGGAGIQADVKTAMACGGYATTVITAITAQNSLGVHGVWPLPIDAVVAQFRSVMDDIGADAIKVGMLGTRELVEVVAHLVASYANQVPVVVDPVCASKHGDSLLAADATTALRQLMIPLATVVTPNVPEAELLLDMTIADEQSQTEAAHALVALGAQWALVKGGHMDGDASDLLSDGSQVWWLREQRSETVHTHGTGCTLASAIATGLARGLTVTAAVEAAKSYITGAIRHGFALGQGIGPVDHGWRSRARD
jgi:hydroxymethylpyrimidine/phosphomethylpyrimidine kinase